MLQDDKLEHACRLIMDMKPTEKGTKIKTDDKVDGCCGQRHNNDGTGKKDGG